MQVDIFLSHKYIDKAKFFDKSIIVTIDVLRASSTICTALNNGAKDFFVFENILETKKFYKELATEHKLLAGERKGSKIIGFTLGNSPFEFDHATVSSKTVVFTSSNGAKIFNCNCSESIKIVSCFLNISATLEFVLEHYKKYNSIKILCAGNNGKFCLEDFLCAEYLVNQLMRKLPGLNNLNSQFSISSKSVKQIQTLAKNGEHSYNLELLGYLKDVEYCLSFDLFDFVPIISENRIFIK